MHDPVFDEFYQQAITPAPPPGILVADHFRASYGYHVKRPAGTRDWLLMYTITGVGRCCVSEQLYCCRAGDVVLLEPGTVHDYATLNQAQPWEFYWTHFLPRPHWLEWMQMPKWTTGLYGLAIVDTMLQQRIENTFNRLLQDLRNPSRLHGSLAANGLEEILLSLTLQDARDKPTRDPRVEFVLSYLNNHYRESVTIDALAQQVSLSPSRLAHIFKQQVGRSIIEKVIAMRLHHAAQLLEYTSLHVGEIAQEVGFQAASYLSRQFTTYYGKGPQAYRRQCQIEHASQTATSASRSSLPSR